MLSRIRDVRRAKGLTLADVAERCKPPTTAQTIGRLETGTRVSVAGLDQPHCPCFGRRFERTGAIARSARACPSRRS